MIATLDDTSAPDVSEGFEAKPAQVRGTTLGAGLFADALNGSFTPAEIRQALETKLCACLAIGGTNGAPVQPGRIRNPYFRALVAAGMSCTGWSVKDLAGCTGNLEGAATLALVATLEQPEWGADDYRLMEVLERLERLQNLACNGGRSL